MNYTIGMHVWAHVKDMAINELDTSLLYPYEEDVECVIQELGRNGKECMLRFAHPGDVPRGVRIGWRKYEDITPMDTDIASLEKRMQGMFKRAFPADVNYAGDAERAEFQRFMEDDPGE